MSIEFVMPSNHLILCLPLLPSIFLNIRVSTMSWFFASGDQSIGASASASVLPMNIQGWVPLGLTGLISVQSKSLLQHQNLKASILWLSAFFMVQHSYPYMTIGKTVALTMHTFVGKMISLPFNILSRFLITFIPSSKCLLISWLPSQFWSLNKICHCFHFFPSYLPQSDGTRCHDLSFSECYVLSQLSHSFLLPLSRGSSVPFCFLPQYHLNIWCSAGG